MTPGQSVCEDCGARVETTGGWSKPSGTAGAATTFTQPVQRADFMLGHQGHLCTACWWARSVEPHVGNEGHEVYQ